MKTPKNFKEVLVHCRSERFGDFNCIGLHIAPRTVNAEKCKIEFDESFEIDFDEETDQYWMPSGWYVVLNTGDNKDLYLLDDGTQVIDWRKIVQSDIEEAMQNANDLRRQRSNDEG